MIQGYIFGDIPAADLFSVGLIHLCVYVYWIRMAQDRLVNYRHLLSKRAVCCQVLQHEVGPLQREGKAEQGVKLHGQMVCHMLLGPLFFPLVQPLTEDH